MSGWSSSVSEVGAKRGFGREPANALLDLARAPIGRVGRQAAEREQRLTVDYDRRTRLFQNRGVSALGAVGTLGQGLRRRERDE